jgi:hypothetical protein
LNTDGIDDSNWYSNNLRAIAEWRKRNRVQQRKNAAKKRWEKEKLKKPIDGGKKPKK